ncbi:MAG: hypothetical protein F6J90_24980 [Moorea sp. SIOASIH]|uniref:hypothetical protein n=1 Tax=Moorena sp. SIOASIH TaxID=2607817 RepID=UPI0013B901DB|nr:hypothetical protein [Moorena sp. SIOASIH]NEO39409.1 hypothetical protein [Moorena sp. SIOASIH]
MNHYNHLFYSNYSYEVHNFWILGNREQGTGNREQGIGNSDGLHQEVRPVANLILNGKSAPNRESTSKKTVPHNCEKRYI